MQPPPSNSCRNITITPIGMDTSLVSSSSSSMERKKRASNEDSNNKQPSLTAVANKKSLREIAILFQNGIDVKDRKYHMRKYRNCFVGRDAVNFLIDTGCASTRKEAVDIGNALMNMNMSAHDNLSSEGKKKVEQQDPSSNGLFRHVCDDGRHGVFKDEYLFYVFTSTALPLLGKADDCPSGPCKNKSDNNTPISRRRENTSSQFISNRKHKTNSDAYINRRRSNNSSSKITNATTCTKNLRIICELFENIVKVKNRKYHFKTYHNCFVGSEAVDLLLQCNLGINTRQEAVDLGIKLQGEYNLFEHVCRQHDFKDEYLFYRFVSKNDRFFSMDDELNATMIMHGADDEENRSVTTNDSSDHSDASLTFNTTTTPINEIKRNIENIAKQFEQEMIVKDYKRHKNVFLASDVINYLIVSNLAKSRIDGVKIGRMFVREINLIQPILIGKEFNDDDSLLFRFVPKGKRFSIIEENSIDKSLSLIVSSSLSSLEDLAELLEVSIPTKTHMYHLMPYTKTFKGCKAVDYLVRSGIVPTRRKAVRLGRILVKELNLFECINNINSEGGIGGYDFIDDNVLFRFTNKEDRRCPPSSQSLAPKENDTTNTSAPTLSILSGQDNEKNLFHSTIETFRAGIKVKNHKYHMKTYKNVFIGSDAVSFLVNSSLSKTRKEAVELGRLLADEYDLFEHATGDHEFKDDFLFYRFKRDSSFVDDTSSHLSDTISGTGTSMTSSCRTMPLDKIAKAFRDSGGVKVKNRKHHFKTYRDCFVGSEAVDYLIGFGVAESRDDAVEIGRALANEFDLFHHVTSDHEFKDEYLFYRFTNLGEITPLSEIDISADTLMEIAGAFETGVPLNDQKYSLRVYRNVFLGSDAVDYLVNTKIATSRWEAVQIGRFLSKEFNLFEHVTSNHEFKDQRLFYRFVPISHRRYEMNKTDSNCRGKFSRDYLKLSTTAIESVLSDDEPWSQKVKQFERKMSLLAEVSYSRDSQRKRLEETSRVDRFMYWAKEFVKLDPRFQILTYFNDIEQVGTQEIERKSMTSIDPVLLRPLLRYIPRSSVFTVWRPTSFDAIQKMMLGEAVGKGLDVKAKSARRGKLSGFVPFCQIGNNKHKRMVRRLPKDGTMRLFFSKNKRMRDSAAQELEEVAADMIRIVQRAKLLLSDQKTDECTKKDAVKNMLLDMSSPSITFIDEYAPACFGLEIPVRLFWETYFVRKDVTRAPDSIYDIGRPSYPAFQDMNFASLRTKGASHRPVVMHYDSNEAATSPFALIMAYEEQDRVMPLVSDFDCFLVGTKGVQYKSPLPPEQIDILKWCVDQTEQILDSPSQSTDWTKRWLGILKEHTSQGFHVDIPQNGFGDPKSMSMMEIAQRRLMNCGAVRHGSESFNYFFPQELDDEYLVIGTGIQGKVPWKYVDVRGLQEILNDKIESGYTFPLNPKWILADSGWKELYDKLMASDNIIVRESLDVWYPRESGIREQIDAISSRHPTGFTRKIEDSSLSTASNFRVSGRTKYELAREELLLKQIN